MPLGGTYLFFDEIEIIEQPFTAWSNAPIRSGRSNEQVARFDERSFVLRESTQQTIRRSATVEMVRLRKQSSVLLHLLGTEQLGAQRWLVGDA
jgi:hypothetical protein